MTSPPDWGWEPSDRPTTEAFRRARDAHEFKHGPCFAQVDPITWARIKSERDPGVVWAIPKHDLSQRTLVLDECPIEWVDSGVRYWAFISIDEGASLDDEAEEAPPRA
ncbi:MAG: hypothetical protein B7733_06160 [Myxococcales bacterium FL481]|nr:MAG: hypothetical protein B7733_06160 [Myxococcales bacterium FL481]